MRVKVRKSIQIKRARSNGYIILNILPLALVVGEAAYPLDTHKTITANVTITFILNLFSLSKIKRLKKTKILFTKITFITKFN